MQDIEFTNKNQAIPYLLIQQEYLHSIILSNQIIAGSKIKTSTYKHVVFDQFTFYASDISQSHFDNCIFENCHFEFSHFKQCLFTNCSFTNCHWSGSSIKNGHFIDCILDDQCLEVINHGMNSMMKSNLKDHTTDIYISLRAA